MTRLVQNRFSSQQSLNVPVEKPADKSISGPSGEDWRIGRRQDRRKERKTSSSMLSQEAFAMKETRDINMLRFITMALLIAIATLASIGIYFYTVHSENERFEDSFATNAKLIIDSFHDAIERRLGAANTMADAITSHALTSGQQFPRVTIPNFEVLGSNTRIQADSPLVYWMPLISEETRKDWEDYVLTNRFAIDEAFAKDLKYRNKEDSLLGLTVGPNGPSLQSENHADGPTVLDDGTGYHPRIWSNGSFRPRRDEPEGSGPYLPIWQASPANAAKQAFLNLNFAQTAGFVGVLPKVLHTKEAIMHRSVAPVPAMRSALKRQLLQSQYRHQLEPLLEDEHTTLAYPVFEAFEEDREVVGVLVTVVYWRLFFTKILPPHASGYICVLDNSYNQTMAYRVDGSKVTYLGDVDPHDKRYDYLEQSADINKYVQERSGPATRSYTTVPLNREFGKYRLRIYPSQDTKDHFTSNKPWIYTVAVLVVILLTSSVLVVLDRHIAERQRLVMDRLVQAAEETAAFEHDLNAFLAHEVRNPIAAAMSAHGFVASVVHELPKNPPEDETISSLEEDIKIIGSSLFFVDDFLRSILDLHASVENKLEVHLAPTDLMTDVFEPVSSILHQRNGQVAVSVDCPKNLIVMTDCLRLKQVIMNLGRNSIKFTTSGFVRMRADVVENQVEISVEDSGPGIPEDKRDHLFEKFQKSLDVLSQGTGIGLSLCERLVELLDGTISLDNTYDSGVPGSPGTRFVVKLHQPALPGESILACSGERSLADFSTDIVEKAPESALLGENVDSALPESLSVLFVDDDTVLRKLFSRSVKKVAPSWKVAEAASGESALQLVEKEAFDLVFMDQYMASTEKQLLGTETVRALRGKAVNSIICGLSANDMKEPFLDAGADAFLLKPLPCKGDAMERVLVRILRASSDRQSSV